MELEKVSDIKEPENKTDPKLDLTCEDLYDTEQESDLEE
jgi:hypothetical protein